MKKASWAVLALVLSAPFWDLGHPLWEVDDARYAEVPREMQASGRLLVGQLDYMDYIEKPPLIYWLGRASYSVFGVSEAAAHLPTALTALAGLLGVWWLGFWLFSPATGTGGALILGTCLQYGGLSHLTTPDMAVSVALLWATALILRVLRRPEDAPWAAPAAWLAMAAAFLSKGLIGMVLPAAWVGMLAASFPALRPGLRRLLLDPGLLLFTGIVGTWVWSMERAVPGFCRVFFLEQHFQRFFEAAKYNRPGPWWYFLVSDPVGLLPWTPAALAGLFLPLWRRKTADPRLVQLALWPVVVIGFFSISSSKLLTYILPAFPFQALLAARFLEDADRPPWLSKWGDGLSLLCAVAAVGALFTAGIFMSVTNPRMAPLSAGTAGLAALALAAMSGAAAWAARPGGVSSRAAAATLAASALCLLGAHEFEPWLSARPIARAISKRLGEAGETPVRLVALDRYLQGVPFYTGRQVDLVNWVGELHYAKRFERYAARFGDDRQLLAWPNPGERVLLTLPKKELPRVSRLRGGAVKDVEDVGPYVLLELSSTAPPAPPPSGAGPKPAP